MKKLLWISVSLLLFGSCVRERLSEGNSANNRLRLSVEVQKLGTETQTRAMVASEEGENMIGSLYLLFFTPDTYRNGALVDYVKVDMPAGSISMNIESEIDVTGTSLTVTNPYTILAVANISDDAYLNEEVESWLLNLKDKSESQVMFEARSYVKEKLPVSPDGLLMNGRFEKVAGRTQINLLLTRNHARLDVYNNVRTTHDLVSASVWNSYPSSSIWGEGITDWSGNAKRIREHYGVDNRTHETGEDGADGKGPILSNIKGGLYVFENQVISPEKNDQQTTCLIVGLKERATGDVTYYRANINPEGNMQLLRRNNAYGLTIRSVGGPGAATEELAYIGQGNSLEYTVGSWNLDDNGLIVSDEYSILSIPTKRINLGRDATTATFSIHTFSTLPDAAPLTVRSQTYTPAGNAIRASLDGNTLIINADALGLQETERRGVIVLSFGGLENSISIFQSGTADDYLRVFLPDGGIPIPPFQPYTGLFSGLIRVEASGTWTAKLYMDGFSFNPLPEPNPKVITFRSTEAINGESFRVYTYSRNEESAPRNAFIVISLNKDPDNYASVVRLSQLNAGAIKLMPDNQTVVIFDGTGNLKDIPDVSNVSQFIVNPKINTSVFPNVYNSWNAEIRQDPNNIYDGRDKFQIVLSQYDADILENNLVKVQAVGVNTTGREQTAILRVYLNSDPSTYTDIKLVQEPAEWNLVATGLSSIPVSGGASVNISVNASAGLHYTATVEDLTPASLSTNGHWACLIDMANGDAKASSLTNRLVSESFKVYFPKLIWPNIDVAPRVTLKVTLVESGEVKTLTVNQDAIVQYAIGSVCQYAASWGQLGAATGTTFVGAYNTNFVTYLSSASMYGPASSYVKTNGTITYKGLGTVTTTTLVPATTRYLHLPRPYYNNLTVAAVKQSILDWVQGDNGILTLNHEEGSAASYNNGWGATYFPGMLYPSNTISGGLGNDIYYIWNEPTNRIVKYLTEDAPWTSGVDDWFNVEIATGGTTTYANLSTVTEPNLIPILRSASGRSVLMIDPKQNVLILSDSEMLNIGTTGVPNPPDAPARFVANLLAYIINAAQYGSYFTDYFWDSPRYLETAPTP